MHYPKLTAIPSATHTVDVFAGCSGRPHIADGEFADMMNMTSDHYPVLAPRGRRGFYRRPASPQGIIAKEKVCYVDGSDFVAGEEVIPMGLSLKAADCPKQLVSMGAYVIIMPDKMYINTQNTADFGHIEAEFVSTGEVSFTLCDAGGTALDAPVEPSAPENAADGDYWIDSSALPHTLKQYSATAGSWTAVADVYVRIASDGIGARFFDGDGVRITGIGEEKLQSSCENALIHKRGADYLIIAALLERSFTQSAGQPVTVRRAMPRMDFLTEAGNRLWGCRYGQDENGNFVNEIYASKLGDFRNWNCFAGLSTDSYRASCGTDGPFTAACAYLGNPLFFKENCLHKVYGSYPASFRLQDTACRGVQKGCHRSLALVDETLFYRSRGGICAYDGSLPVDVSKILGEQPCTAAVGGAIGGKYYISMAHPEKGWQLFVYDTARNLWHKEDNLQADGFCAHEGELYCIDGGSRNIITMLGSGEEDTRPVRWMVQTGRIGLQTTDRKYLACLNVRLQLEAFSRAEFYVRYDSGGDWQHLCTAFSGRLRSVSVPIRPHRCDHMQLRIEGEGMAKIHAITEIWHKGSDIR